MSYQDTHSHEHYFIQPHPMHKRGYQIVKTARGMESRPVGEYIVMDKKESPDVTQQKIAALQECLNNKDIGTDLQKPQKQFVSFQRVGVSEDDEMPEKIIFYNNIEGKHGETHREVNAILTFAKSEIQH